MKYRKRPVEIEARQLTGEANIVELAEWCGGRIVTQAVVGQPNNPIIEIDTLEGVMAARTGDWIVCGVAGEFYPVKDAIFRETYEPVQEDTPMTSTYPAPVAALIARSARLTADEAAALAAAWDAVPSAAWRAAVGAVLDALTGAWNDALDDAEAAAARATIRDAVVATVVRDLISEEHFRILTGPWRAVIGDPAALDAERNTSHAHASKPDGAAARRPQPHGDLTMTADAAAEYRAAGVAEATATLGAMPEAAATAAAEAIDAEFRANTGEPKPRWARDLAITALEAAAPHLAAAGREREAQLDHCPGCGHWYGTCGCGCCAHVARAVDAERERLGDALADALDGLQDMIGYVPEYFREKWDHQGYIDRARRVLGLGVIRDAVRDSDSSSAQVAAGNADDAVVPELREAESKLAAVAAERDRHRSQLAAMTAPAAKPASAPARKPPMTALPPTARQTQQMPQEQQAAVPPEGDHD